MNHLRARWVSAWRWGAAAVRSAWTHATHVAHVLAQTPPGC